MRFCDSERIRDIELKVWEGNQYLPSIEADFFDVGHLKYNTDLDAFIVEDVEYLIDQALDWKYGEGDFKDYFSEDERTDNISFCNKAVVVDGKYTKRTWKIVCTWDEFNAIPKCVRDKVIQYWNPEADYDSEECWEDIPNADVDLVKAMHMYDWLKKNTCLES